jgi:hypothetical protein
MGTFENLKFWVDHLVGTWRDRRDDESGGVTDETALMGALALVAIGVGAALITFLQGKIGSINIGW